MSPALPAPWDADALDRVRHLHLVAREAVAGLHVGPHLSVRSGHDVEFFDFKPYDLGDPLKHVDWRVLARADRLVVRRHRAETELAATLVLDASADLGSVPGKFETAVQLTACLAWLLHTHGDPVGLVVLGPEAPPLPPRSGRVHLARLFARLAEARPTGRGHLDDAFRGIGARLGPRALVAVISDFMEPTEGWLPSLAALVRQRADLRAFHVMDPAELALEGARPSRFFSPEEGAEFPIDPAGIRTAFAAVVQEWLAEVKAALQSHRGLYQEVHAGASLAPHLARFLAGRP